MNKLNVVGAVLIKNNKILLPKRSSSLKTYPNKYEFPGGKVEKNETLVQALKRELKEELSIDIDLNNIIQFPNNTIEMEKFILTIFIVNQWNNELTLNPEINSEILEVNIDELKKVEELLESDKLLIPAIIRYLNLYPLILKTY
jgi:8-oxo-dGTP diphosphatase